MDFLLLVMLVLLLIGIVSHLTPKPGEAGGADDKFVIQKKQCPPHQWFWQEIVDQDGVKHGERIVCKVCGPLRSQSGREE